MLSFFVFPSYGCILLHVGALPVFSQGVATLWGPEFIHLAIPQLSLWHFAPLRPKGTAALSNFLNRALAAVRWAFRGGRPCSHKCRSDFAPPCWTARSRPSAVCKLRGRSVLSPMPLAFPLGLGVGGGFEAVLEWNTVIRRS